MKTHTCKWPACWIEIDASKWACKRHWHTIPAQLRTRLNRAWRMLERGRKLAKLASIATLPEVRGRLRRVSGALREYRDAESAIEEWIEQNASEGRGSAAT